MVNRVELTSADFHGGDTNERNVARVNREGALYVTPVGAEINFDLDRYVRSDFRYFQAITDVQQIFNNGWDVFRLLTGSKKCLFNMKLTTETAGAGAGRLLTEIREGGSYIGDGAVRTFDRETAQTASGHTANFYDNVFATPPGDLIAQAFAGDSPNWVFPSLIFPANGNYLVRVNNTTGATLDFILTAVWTEIPDDDSQPA